MGVNSDSARAVRICGIGTPFALVQARDVGAIRAVEVRAGGSGRAGSVSGVADGCAGGGVADGCARGGVDEAAGLCTLLGLVTAAGDAARFCVVDLSAGVVLRDLRCVVGGEGVTTLDASAAVGFDVAVAVDETAARVAGASAAVAVVAGVRELLARFFCFAC